MMKNFLLSTLDHQASKGQKGGHSSLATLLKVNTAQIYPNDTNFCLAMFNFNKSIDQFQLILRYPKWLDRCKHNIKN